MELRITPQTTVSNALANLRQQTDQIGILLEQASSGKRILSPSDDPAATQEVLQNRAQEQQFASFLANIQEATTALDSADPSLREVSNLFSQARQVAIQGSESRYDATSIDTLGEQVNSLLKRLLDLANTKQNDRFLFSGTATQTTPFTVTSTDSAGRPLTIAYQGASQRASVAVSQQQTVDTRYTGSGVFQQRERGVTVYSSGGTGAAAGAGTDSATGQDQLLVAHTATIYDPAPGSGILLGASSAAGDTVLGPFGAHSVNIVDTSGTGASGTIALDGGGALNWTSADTNLQVNGPGKATVFVDMSAITAGFSGTVNITANGTLSVDGGASSTAVNFSANQVVTDSVTGAVTNVDSTNIRTTGTEQVNYSGTYDAFQILVALRDDLFNTRNLNQKQQTDSISSRIAELDRAQNGVLRSLGEQGSSLQDLQGLESRAKDFQFQTRQLTANLEDVDVSQVVVNLQAQQTQLRLTLAASARIFDQSLLDFIR